MTPQVIFQKTKIVSSLLAMFHCFSFSWSFGSSPNWWESLGFILYLGSSLFRLGSFYLFTLVSYWIWWEMYIVWGLHKAKTCICSVDLRNLNFTLQLFALCWISAWWCVKWERDLLGGEAKIHLYPLYLLLLPVLHLFGIRTKIPALSSTTKFFISQKN